jgi:hypothetical protein
MSWRTRGSYRGLAPSDWRWLHRFNRRWDTKKEGRARGDALDLLRRVLIEISRPEANPTSEPNLKLLADEVARFTAPKAIYRGWGIHLTLKSGEKVLVRFKTRDEAEQAASLLHEALSILPAA